MKSFYSSSVSVAPALGALHQAARSEGSPARSVYLEAERADEADVASHRLPRNPSPARIAVYDAQGAPPRVEEIMPVPIGDYISQLAARTYEIARAMGGTIPFTVVSEVVENFIHADFHEPVVTILDSGETIRFSDQGPGIVDKRRAVEPGYTTATREMKRYVRGVGSGLPLVCECLSFSGGSLLIEDNLGRGAVVTVTNKPPSTARHGAPAPVPSAPATDHPLSEKPSMDLLGLAPMAPPDRRTPDEPDDGASLIPPLAAAGVVRLTNRQKRVLALVMEAGSAGPSLVARELSIGLSTAYRDLAKLEELELISADASGKRVITADGSRFLKTLLHAE